MPSILLIDYGRQVYYWKIKEKILLCNLSRLNILNPFGTFLTYFIFKIKIHIWLISLTVTHSLHVFLQTLKAPEGFEPTKSEARGWIINPLGEEKDLPIWAIFLAIVPAILIFILMFMETQITRWENQHLFLACKYIRFSSEYTYASKHAIM